MAHKQDTVVSTIPRPHSTFQADEPTRLLKKNTIIKNKFVKIVARKFTKMFY